MSFSVEFIFRIIGAIIAAVAATIGGIQFAHWLETAPDAYAIIFGLVGFLTGLILTPYLTTRPLRAIRRQLSHMSAGRLTAIIAGIFLGLVAAALLSLPLSLLPAPFRQIMPLATAVIFCYLSVIILTTRQNDLQSLFNSFRPGSVEGLGEKTSDTVILLDTSVIIDGRVADISQTGFIQGTLLIPNFVLFELQHIADSADAMRRNRGRRGLEILSILQNEAPIPTRITDMDVSEVRDVDSKLVSLARHLRCPIMTNDYNLNRVAEIQGVTVLNINDLANAVKAIFLPGEEIMVKIIQEGRELGQGVGYLDDGTMVVVEEGRKLINSTRNVTVTKVLQTAAGRMIFAKP
ncbi:MAG: PIN domain nuclease [Ardenticatenaceae bacterium]|nr:PIN domain nuclease [Ardenticatenaceae bacterium]MCB9446535.1 PIN domain nuclease [Ardenticatenaceae bacterium]